MPSLLQTFLLLALVTFVLAIPAPAPAPAPVQKRSFKVERVPNPNFRRAVNHVRAPGAGTRALVKAYRKYSVPLPAGLLDAMGQAQQGAAGAGGAAGGAGGAGGLDALISGLLGGGSTGTGNAKDPNAASSASAAGTKGAGAKGTGTGAKGTGTKASATKSAGGAKSTGTSGGASRNGTGVAAASANGTGLVTATPEQGDVEYLSPVKIGGQTINMDFDSGSSDLWVFNTQLAANTQTGHTIFDATKSSTFKMLSGATYSISYGDGSGSAGNVGTDTVNIGGATVTNQAVELPTAVSGSFITDTQSNGLVGLAFSKLNTVKPTQQKTFFDNAIPSLPQPVFTADLRAASVGAYEFGTIDTTKFNGTMQWAAVNTTNGFWQFSSSKFQVGATGQAMSLAGGQAIADTGTTLMLVDPSIVNAYYSQVTGAVNNATVGGVVFPCSSTLPDLMVDVGGNFMATVRGNDINFAPVDAGSTTCYGGVQAIQSSLQIYGDIMFKSQFVAFNGGNNSIGMAPHQ